MLDVRTSNQDLMAKEIPGHYLSDLEYEYFICSQIRVQYSILACSSINIHFKKLMDKNLYNYPFVHLKI